MAVDANSDVETNHRRTYQVVGTISALSDEDRPYVVEQYHVSKFQHGCSVKSYAVNNL